MLGDLRAMLGRTRPMLGDLRMLFCET